MKKTSAQNKTKSSAAISSFNVTRRSFLSRCTMLAAASGLPLWFVEKELLGATPESKPLSANDRPSVALVGCGGMGNGDIRVASRFGDVVAVCDVDENHAAETARRLGRNGKNPDTYGDFRKLLERNDIHVIVNATPDHWHTLVNMAAIKAGKDVYSEKPLTLTVDEGRRLVKMVRESKCVLQTGSQQRSDAKFRMACELVRNERIGKLKEVTVWLPAGLRKGPFTSAPVPQGLNWDFWLGQAPKVDYEPHRCHTYFRYWYDYSGGTMTDWGAHHNDIALWAIGLPGPVAVEGTPRIQPIPGGYNAFSEYDVKCTFEGGLVMNIRTTSDDSPFGEALKENGQRNGIRFEGTNGWIWVNRGNLEASDDAIIQTKLPENAVRLYSSNDHMGNLFDCVRSRKQPICDVEVGHRSASVGHIGVIALRLGAKLNWDPVKETFTGDRSKEANAMLTREMRKPYDYSFIG
jgi:predicted dehydrogenase